MARRTFCVLRNVVHTNVVLCSNKTFRAQIMSCWDSNMPIDAKNIDDCRWWADDRLYLDVTLGFWQNWPHILAVKLQKSFRVSDLSVTHTYIDTSELGTFEARKIDCLSLTPSTIYTTRPYSLISIQCKAAASPFDMKKMKQDKKRIWQTGR